MNAHDFVEKAKKLDELQQAQDIKNKHHIIFSNEGKFFKYIDGYYQTISEDTITKHLADEYGCLKSHSINLIIKYLRAFAEIDSEHLNNNSFLNLENGLFDIKNNKLLPHSPDVISTIRLNVSYNEKAECPLWVDTVNKIIEDQENIDVLQEFFGLCLTRETYDKALFIIGEGNNGKSTLLDVLKDILGEANTCSIQLEQLDNRNYIAQLHNKTLNIASEIKSKSTVSDEMFKKIVTHDYIMGDHKFGHPFSFRPVCKLVFAANKMPRTDDKSSAFYRRLLIMPLKKVFTMLDEKHKYHRVILKTERSGVFNWMITGLNRLEARGRFASSKQMIDVVENYKIENNTVLSFIDECCTVETDASVSKREIYQCYRRFSEDGGYRALNIKKFGKELIRFSPDAIKEERTANGRFWGGIMVGKSFNFEAKSSDKVWDEENAE